MSKFKKSYSSTGAIKIKRVPTIKTKLIRKMNRIIKQRYIFVTEKMAVASFKRYIKNLKKSK